MRFGCDGRGKHSKNQPSITDVAQRFGVSRETVLSWIDAGLLIAIDTAPAGSKRRFFKVTQEAIAAFEKLRSTGKPQQPITHRLVRKYF